MHIDISVHETFKYVYIGTSTKKVKIYEKKINIICKCVKRVVTAQRDVTGAAMVPRAVI